MELVFDYILIIHNSSYQLFVALKKIRHLLLSDLLTTNCTIFASKVYITFELLQSQTFETILLLLLQFTPIHFFTIDILLF